MLLKRSYLTISLLIQPLKLLIYLYTAFIYILLFYWSWLNQTKSTLDKLQLLIRRPSFFIYTIYLYNQVRPHKADILIECVFNLFIYISLINRRFFILYNLNRIHLIYLYIKYLYISYVLFHRGYSIIFFVIFYYISI